MATKTKHSTKAIESYMTIEALGTFGEFNRYRLERCTSKRPLLIELGGAVTYAVVDAETIDEVTGLPAVIRQESTPEAAMAGLCDRIDMVKLLAAA